MVNGRIINTFYIFLLFSLILITPLNAQNDDVVLDFPDPNLQGVEIGDKFSFHYISGSDNIIFGSDSGNTGNVGNTSAVPPSSTFSVTILDDVQQLSGSAYWNYIPTEVEFNDTIKEHFSYMNRLDRTGHPPFILLTDWIYYERLAQNGYEELQDFTSNHALLVGRTENEFVLIESIDDSSKPVGTGHVINSLIFEVRYDLYTGALNYVETTWSVSRDYGPPFTVYGSMVLSRTGYQYVSLNSDDIKQIIQKNEGANSNYPTINLIALSLVIVIVRIFKRE